MNRVRERWASNEPAVGSFLTIPSARSAEAFGAVGYDWVLVEQQHGAVAQESLLHVLQALALAGSTSLVRVGEADLVGLSRALDLGAHGIVVPMVSTREQAIAIAAATRYPPRGTRSLGGARGYRLPADANEDVLCIPMIETPEGVRNAELIAKVDGVDALLLGPADLALCLGLEIGTPEASRVVLELFGEVVEACGGTDAVPGYVAMNEQEARAAIDAGAQLVVYRSDLSVLIAAAKADVAFIESLRRAGGIVIERSNAVLPQRSGETSV